MHPVIVQMHKAGGGARALLQCGAAHESSVQVLSKRLVKTIAETFRSAGAPASGSKSRPKLAPPAGA
jgi:hypothetical protein